MPKDSIETKWTEMRANDWTISKFGRNPRLLRDIDKQKLFSLDM